MRRRTFIAGLGGAAAWPMVARGQNSTPGKIWRVGYLSVSSTTNFTVALLNKFKLKLQELGYVEGKTFSLMCDVRNSTMLSFQLSQQNLSRSAPM
jgi:hypothetical protein